jgi:hypothetical protein
MEEDPKPLKFQLKIKLQINILKVFVIQPMENLFWLEEIANLFAFTI